MHLPEFLCALPPTAVAAERYAMSTKWENADFDALKEEQRIMDQREEAHRSRLIRRMGLQNREEQGEEDGMTVLLNMIAYGMWQRAENDEYTLKRQRIIDAMIDAVDTFMEENSATNQEIFFSVYGEMRLKKDVAKDLGRFPTSVVRTLKRMQKNLKKYLIQNYPDLLEEYLSGLYS